MMPKKTTQPAQQHPNNNQVETLKGFASDISKTFGDQLLKNGTRTMWEQILGHYEQREHSTPSGDLIEGEEIDLVATKETHQKHDVAPGIDYRREILQYTEVSVKHETREIEEKIKEVLFELRRLIETSTVLQAEFKEVTMEQAPAIPGKYHLNFLEWLLQIIKTARIKVEDSGSWLTAITTKKSKRNYWSMFKKHGTTFGLSNERVVATQTG